MLNSLTPDHEKAIIVLRTFSRFIFPMNIISHNLLYLLYKLELFLEYGNSNILINVTVLIFK